MSEKDEQSPENGPPELPAARPPRSDHDEKPDPGPPEPPRPERRLPLWQGPQQFPDTPETPKESKKAPSDQRRRRSPELDRRQWLNNRATQEPRGEGMSHDGQNLGYGASHHTHGRTDASGSRGANFGHVGRDINNTFLNFGTEHAPPTGHYTEQDLIAIRRRYAPTGGEARISELLRERHVVVLRARAQSGRRTTALYCLDDQLRSALSEQSYRVDILSPGEDLASVSRYLKDSERGPCFLLDATGHAWPRTVTDTEFRTAFGSFSASNRRLVVLVDEPAPSRHLSAVLIDHEPPATRELLLAHLTDLVASRYAAPREHAERLLSEAEAADRGRFAPSPAASWMAAMSCPEEAALLATTIDRWDRGESGTSLGEAAGARRRFWLDRRARELLAPTDPKRSPSDQAYVLAGAVLSGMPGAVISWAAERLVRILRGDSSATEDATSFFTEPVERRLRHMSIRETSEGTSVLELAQPELGDALLHVTWHEYSRTQQPLLDWLALLCESEEHGLSVVLSAAQALAQIAGYVPDMVLERTVDVWSDWNRADSPQQCVWAAAWLMEKLVFNQSPHPEALTSAPPDDPRVRVVASVARRLRRWADTSALNAAQISPTLTDTDDDHGAISTHFPRWMTAMVTYGTYAGRVPPIRSESTTALRAAADLAMRTRRFAFLYSAEELGPFLVTLAEVYTEVLIITATDAYQDGARVPVIRELARWSTEGSPDLLLLACHTLLSIAEIRAEDSENRKRAGSITEVNRDDRPYDLLLWLSTGAEGLSESGRNGVRALWIAALSHPDTAQKAWSRLFRWDLQAALPTAAGLPSAPVLVNEGAPVPPLREFLTDLFEEIYTQPRLRHLHARLDKYYLLRTRIAPEEFPEPQGDPR
ncbi:hypothetical protein GTW20_05980 [Nocardiopsis alba]|uniref:Uncharacterized protein n=1 Tax=Nocardiopsis alba TaxID=53437 RepID=A0A7K2IPC4_9ACTN|nr:hypothetical protein [Nocardiopsis alba]MYR31832.1 hypothetical protein [Nocardiopsis alba]